MNIILKTDDFRGDMLGYNKTYDSYITLIASLKIKASIGVIGQSMEHISDKKALEMSELIKSKILEPYNHSYYHVFNQDLREFNGTSEEYQSKSINKTQEIVKNKLNFIIHTFGTVCNSWDSNTIKLIYAHQEITHIYAYEHNGYYNAMKNRLKNKQLILLNGYGILEHKEENKTAINYDRFVSLFSNLLITKTITFQLHPGSWIERDVIELEKILKYLIEQKHTFIFPSEIKNE